MIWNWNSSWNFNREDYDWEAFKKQGTVTESVEEHDGYKTITKTFISADGKTRITSSESSPIIDETQQRLNEIENEIKEAVKKEDYEKAANLKKEKEKLTNKKEK
jgi:protein-arginine kinase activator protein McsA